MMAVAKVSREDCDETVLTAPAKIEDTSPSRACLRLKAPIGVVFSARFLYRADMGGPRNSRPYLWKSGRNFAGLGGGASTASSRKKFFGATWHDGDQQPAW
jgi:hypothetical protein